MWDLMEFVWLLPFSVFKHSLIKLKKYVLSIYSPNNIIIAMLQSYELELVILCETVNYSLSVVLRILLGALYHVWVCLYLIKSGKFWTNYLIEYAKLGLGCQLVLSNDFQCLCPLRVGCHLLLSFLILKSRERCMC